MICQLDILHIGEKIQSIIQILCSNTPHYVNNFFDLPEGWVWCNITNLTSKITDGTHHSPVSYHTGTYKYITAKNIKTSGIDLSNISYVDESTHIEIYNRCNPEFGDILYIKDGATTGIVTLNSLREQFSLLSSVALIKPLKGINNKFLLYFLQSPYCYDKVRETMKGVGITRITLKQIEQWNIPLPPQKEQDKIVEEIEKWFSLINYLEKEQTCLKEAIKYTKAKVLDLAIQGKLIPQDPNDEPACELLKRINPKAEIACDNGQYVKIPRNWAMVKMGDIFTIVSAKRVLKSEWRTNGIPFYRAREIARLSEYNEVNNELFIDPKHYNELKNKYGVPTSGDIMLSAVGTIGKSYIVKDSDKFYYKDASVLCLRNVNRLNSKYFSMLFSSSLLINQMKENSKGTTVDTITLEKIKSYIIPFPPLSEQERIVQNVEKLFMILNTIGNSLEA